MSWSAFIADPAHAIVAAGAAVAAALLLWGAFTRLSRFLRRLVHFLDDWQGEAARPGVSARPGVMERLDDHGVRIASIERQTRQLTPNGGSHLADKVERIEAQLKQVPNSEALDRIEALLAVVNLSNNPNHQPTVPSGEDLPS